MGPSRDPDGRTHGLPDVRRFAAQVLAADLFADGRFVTKTSSTGVDGGGLPVGLGFRVPCIIVSPWTTGGYVFSETSDHTSQLRLLERITGVKETNISPRQPPDVPPPGAGPPAARGLIHLMVTALVVGRSPSVRGES